MGEDRSGAGTEGRPRALKPPPDRLYGYALDSNYQGQEVALSKHFKRERARGPSQPSLFS